MNSAMKPFQNKGWPYLKKFKSILLQSSAKGKHAYIPTSIVPMLPDLDLESIVESRKELGKQADEKSEWELRNTDTGAGMDVDGCASAIPSILVSEILMRKCGFSMLSVDNDSLAGSFTAAPPSSPPTYSSRPPQKKRSTGSFSVASSSQSASMITNWSSRSTSMGRITSAIALNSMQGSIN